MYKIFLEDILSEFYSKRNSITDSKYDFLTYIIHNAKNI